MFYRPVLIHHAELWPDPYAESMADGYLLIEDGTIVSMGSGKLPNVPPGTESIHARGQLLMPGLVQTHVHLCQTIFRGIAEDLPLLPWLRGYIWPMEAAHRPESIQASTRLAAAELIRSGTTAFMSMETVRHTDAVVEALRSTGLIGLVCHCLMDETAGYPDLAVPVRDGLAQIDRLMEQVRDEPLLDIGVAPRFVLSCSEANMKEAAAYARQHGRMLHTHAAEQMEEVQLVRERTGRHNVEYLHELGMTGPNVALAHCVHTEAHERAILRDTDTRVLHCPSANLKLGSGIAPVPEYLEMGLTVSLGADGTPCNNRLDGFLEMREAALIQKPRRGADALSARDVLRMATAYGARTLRREADFGRLAPGRMANLILLNPDSPHVAPCEDPASRVVYAHEASDVTLTMVHGRVLYRDGEFTTLDLPALLADAREERVHLERRAGLRS